MRPWILSEINYGYVKDHPYDVAVLPLGATEPHNLHLPYGTDTFEAEAIAGRVCEAAFQRGATRVVMLPPVPYGTETNQMEFPLAMNVNPSTLGMLIRDLVDSLAKHRILEAGAAEQPRRERLQTVAAGTDRQDAGAALPVRLVPRASVDVQKTLFKEPGDHAGAMETGVAWPGVLPRVRRPRPEHRCVAGRRRRHAGDAV